MKSIQTVSLHPSNRCCTTLELFVYSKSYGRSNSKAETCLSPFQKWPLTPIIPLSTMHCSVRARASPLSWVICCVNTLYLQLTALLAMVLEMQLQAANISIVITEGCDANFGPLCNRGRY